VSPVVVGGLGPQLATHHVQPDSSQCSDELVDGDSSSWRAVRTVYIAAKTDLKFDGNQTRNFNVVLRKIVGTNVHRRTVCSYEVRDVFLSASILLFPAACLEFRKGIISLLRFKDHTADSCLSAVRYLNINL